MGFGRVGRARAPSPVSPNVSLTFGGRQFTFFDVIPVRDIHDLADSPDIFNVGPFNYIAYW